MQKKFQHNFLEKILEKLEGEQIIFLHTKKAKRAELEKTWCLAFFVFFPMEIGTMGFWQEKNSKEKKIRGGTRPKHNVCNF